MKILDYIKNKFYKQEVKTEVSKKTVVNNNELPKLHRNMIFSYEGNFLIEGYVTDIYKRIDGSELVDVSMRITDSYCAEGLIGIAGGEYINCLHLNEYGNIEYTCGYVEDCIFSNLMYKGNICRLKVILDNTSDKYKSIEIVDNYVKLSNKQYVDVRTMEIVTDETTINLLNMML